MIILTAHDYVSIVLPNPKFSDNIGNSVILGSKYTMTGDLYTNKKTSNLYKMTFTFNLPKGVSIALIQFLKSYISSEIRIQDHTDKTWLGYILTNPIPTEFDDWGTITIEFEGRQL